jgi:chitosanase
MITVLQKKTTQAIVNIFETGRPLGDYGNVTVMKGDTGHLTYGRSQTTLASGNLALLLHTYCESGGILSGALQKYLSVFDRRDTRLDRDEKVKGLLRQAGADPVMRQVQDEFFDRIYWAPALKSADNIGISTALGISVVYDSRVHGSFERIRDLTMQKQGTPAERGEEGWITAYVDTRKSWLANHANELLHKTVYRMDAFRVLIREEKWQLELPLTLRGVVISRDTFKEGYAPVSVVSAEDVRRVLFLTRPMLRGKDVKGLQKALGFSGDDLDGVFGKETDAAVKAFQKKHGLKVDGRVGPATRSALGID